MNKIEKKFKKFKTLFPTLFLAKTGWDWPRKREKNFSPEFRSYSPQARIFTKNRKKNNKNKKLLSSIIFSQNGMRLAEKEKKNSLIELAKKIEILSLPMETDRKKDITV